MLPSCRVKCISHGWSCPNRPKSYHKSYFLSDLLKGLLMLKDPLDLVLLPGHLIEEANKLTITENVHSP